MTRDQFIDRYLHNSNFDSSYKTATGFRIANRDYVALPCACGEDVCDGWCMALSAPKNIARASADTVAIPPGRFGWPDGAMGYLDYIEAAVTIPEPLRITQLKAPPPFDHGSDVGFFPFNYKWPTPTSQ